MVQEKQTISKELLSYLSNLHKLDKLYFFPKASTALSVLHSSRYHTFILTQVIGIHKTYHFNFIIHISVCIKKEKERKKHITKTNKQLQASSENVTQSPKVHTVILEGQSDVIDTFKEKQCARLLDNHNKSLTLQNRNDCIHVSASTHIVCTEVILTEQEHILIHSNTKEENF